MPWVRVDRDSVYDTNPPRCFVSRLRMYTSRPYAEPWLRGSAPVRTPPLGTLSVSLMLMNTSSNSVAVAVNTSSHSTSTPALDCTDVWRPPCKLPTARPGSGTMNDGGWWARPTACRSRTYLFTSALSARRPSAETADASPDRNRSKRRPGVTPTPRVLFQ